MDRCQNPRCNRLFQPGEWKLRPSKPYPDPKPEFCCRGEADTRRDCYDAYFAIPANKAKLYAAFNLPMPDPAPPRTHPAILGAGGVR